MEIRGSQTPQHSPPPPEEALLSPPTLERTSSTFSVAPTIVRVASELLVQSMFCYIASEQPYIVRFRGTEDQHVRVKQSHKPGI